MHRRSGHIHHFEPGSRLRVYRTVPSGFRTNATFEVLMLGVPTAHRCLFAPFRGVLEGGTMALNHG